MIVKKILKNHFLHLLYKERKIVLIFNTMWNKPLNIPKEQIPQEFIFTTDHRYFNDAYAIIFHLPTLNDVLEGDLNKPDNQKWIAWSMESDKKYPFQKDYEFMELFDYRMTYNMHADIICPYYKYNFLKEFRKPSNTSSKESNICMMISSEILSSLQEYLKELMLYVDIDSYGRLLNNKELENDIGTDAKLELYSKYKFVIAFENSFAEDYVTEKFYDPILVGAVPIYFGALNIDEFAPGENSYIDIRNFKSPKELADFLIKCCRDNALYKTFFEWKTKPYLPFFEQKVKAIEKHHFVRLCSVLSKEKEFPTVSVVTISYGKGDDIENTIKSIVNQTYPNIEYIVVDGGSKDNTVEVLKKYEDSIFKWVSEPDKGIYHAMNKGIGMSTGEWIIFINSGDELAANNVIADMVEKIDFTSDIIYGDLKVLMGDRTFIWQAYPIRYITKKMVFGHPATIIKNSVMKQEMYDENYKCAADYDFFYKSYIKGRKFQYIPIVVSIFEGMIGLSSTNKELALSDCAKIHAKYKNHTP